MSVDDRTRWDTIFERKATQPYPAPDPLLLQYTPPVPPETTPRALDVAAGVGQNGLWLAEQGYHTDLMDISRVGLRRARAEMGMRNLRNANLLQVDLDNLQLEASTYDLICVFRYLKRRLFSLLKMATVPGGRIIYETFNMRYLETVPAFNQKFLLEPGELYDHFRDWRILFREDSGTISRIVAVKP